MGANLSSCLNPQPQPVKTVNMATNTCGTVSLGGTVYYNNTRAWVPQGCESDNNSVIMEHDGAGWGSCVEAQKTDTFGGGDGGDDDDTNGSAWGSNVSGGSECGDGSACGHCHCSRDCNASLPYNGIKTAYQTDVSRRNKGNFIRALQRFLHDIREVDICHLLNIIRKHLCEGKGKGEGKGEGKALLEDESNILIDAWKKHNTPPVIMCLIANIFHKHGRQKELGKLPPYYTIPRKMRKPVKRKNKNKKWDTVDCHICQNRRGGCKCCTSCNKRNGECTCGKQCTEYCHKCCICTECCNNMCNCTCAVLEFLSLWS